MVPVMKVLRLLAIVGAAVLVPTIAWSQCSGQFTAGQVCGVSGSAQAQPRGALLSPLLDRNFGAPSAQGTILNRGVSAWSATSGPVLGLAGVTTGTMGFAASGGGTVTVSPATATSTWTFQLPPNAGTANYVLITDGSGHTSWVSNTSGGTVTSVGLSAPAEFTVSGSPVIASGTLTFTKATQSANTVWAGPTSGSAAQPAFRALVGADLPNPSASTLGGIQSYVGVGSQWIRSISTSGVPSSSQPAFTDISGSVAAAQLPNPTASTLGGVQSFAAVTSKWINTISTSGVPSATQPSFSDISGAVALAQFPTISSNSVLGNNSGGSSIPSGLTASQVFDFIGSTQGDVLYRNGSVWTVLPPGTNGQVLTTAGAAANPSWTTVTGTGTVTSVGTGTGLTGGPITGSGTVSFASIANNTVLSNVSGGSAAPSANAPTAILDVIGSAQGDILYRGASNWEALPPGTTGQVLQTQGAGATPQWANAGTVSSITAGAGLSGGTITTSGTITTAAGVPANILNTQTSNYSIATTDCGKTIQAGTGSTGPFTVTLPAVAGFSSNCVVTIKNGDTARAKFLSGFPSDLLARLMPLQATEVGIINGAWVTLKNPGQWMPLSAVTIFVDNINGSDSNDCLAAGSGNACLTPAGALSVLSTYINNVNGVTIQWTASGSYTGQIVGVSYNGPGAVTLDGNSSSLTVSSAAGGCIFCIGSAANSAAGVTGTWYIRRFTIATGANGIFGIVCSHSVCITLDGMVAATLTGGSYFTCTQGANCKCANNFSVTGTAMLHLFDQSDSSTMKCGGITVTQSGALVLSGAFVSTHGSGLIDLVGITWTIGGSVTGPRYYADLMALIDSGACNSIPGSIAGSPTAGSLGTSGGFCN